MMKALKTLAISALAFASFAAPAMAQDGERWVAPGGLFSLDFDSFGWTELPASMNTDGTILGIEHNGFQERHEAMRTCFLTERRGPVPGSASQSRLNDLSRRTNGVFSHTGAPLTLERIEIDGVLVTDATYERPFYQHMRWFYLSNGREVIQYHINCGVSGQATAPADVAANVTSMLDTLDFPIPN